MSQYSNTLAEDNFKNFKAYILEGELVILDLNGKCVLSSEPMLHGKKIDVFSSSVEFVLSPRLTQVLIGNYLELKRISQSSIDQFFARLINGPIDISNLSLFETRLIFTYESEALTLGLNLNLPRVAVLVKYPDFEKKVLLNGDPSFEPEENIQRLKREIRQTFSGFFSKSAETIISYLGDSNFVIFKPLSRREEGNFFKLMKNSYRAIFGPVLVIDETIGIGYGYPHSGVIGLIKAFKEANLAIELGRHFEKKKRIFFYGDIDQLYILAKEAGSKQTRSFTRLLDGNLIRTLEVFFAQNLNVSMTAERLKIHRNSVVYRLDKVTRLLNLNPRHFDEAASIKIGLLANRFI